MKELYKIFRPKTLDEIVGQDSIVKELKKRLANKNLPQSILLTGMSGSGKTSTARILKKELNCSDHDFTEKNMASTRGIDTIRQIEQSAPLSPMSGDCRIWLLDEVHSATTEAFESFLKLLEDTPKHCYFFLATTKPEKLPKTIKTRCLVLDFKPLSEERLEFLIDQIAKKAEISLASSVVKSKIVEYSDGSARQALVWLEKIGNFESEGEQLACISRSEDNIQIKSLITALLNPKSQWIEIARIIKGLKEEPETIRWSVLMYCNAILVNGARNGRALQIMNAFQYPFYETKMAGVTMACFEIVNSKE